MAGDDDFLEPEMKGLPDDPMLAFAIYEQRLRAVTRDNADGSGWTLERRYAKNLWAFIQLEGLPIPIEEPPPDDMMRFPEWYNEFVQRVDDYLFEYRLARARGRSPVL